MEANELTDGIYVYFNCFDDSKIIVKVTGFKDGVVYGISETGSHWCTIEKVEPIPITPEILEKNEFVQKSDGWLWCKIEGIEDKNYIFIQFRKGCDEVRLVELNFVNKVLARYEQIHYVHELQHVLRICGNEKTIELWKL